MEQLISAAGRLQRKFAVIAFIWAALSAHAAVISKVNVDARIPNVDTESIRQLVLFNVRSTVGSTFSEKVLNEDVKRLHRTHSFESVQTRWVPGANDTVEITFLVVPKPILESIQITGNKEFKETRIRSLISHATGTPLDDDQLFKDAGAIREKYRKSGYYAAKVEVKKTPREDRNGVDVVFAIDEGSRAKLKKVLFTGRTAFSEGELRKAVTTKRPWWKYIFRWGNFYNEQVLDLDKDKLAELYATKGYLDFAVKGVETSFNRKNTWVTVIFHLEEGSTYTLGKIDIDGNKRFSNDELLPRVQMKPGETYSSTVEDQDTKRISAMYEPLGYLDLRCFPVHEVNTDTHVVDVTYRLREGVPSHIRDVYIVGNRVTKDHVIRRELAIHPGDLGDSAKVRASKARLEDLNYFETISISPMSTEVEGLKDLRVEVEEKRTGQFMLGAGFSSEDSLLGYVEVAQSNFDIGDWPGLRGGGQKLRMRAQVGTERHDLLVSFVEPWWLDRRLRLQLDAYSNTRYEDEYEQQTLGISAMVTRPWKTFWRQSVGLKIEDYKLTDFDTDVSAELLDEEGSYMANRLVYRLTRDTRNSSRNPEKGTLFNFGTEVVTQALGSYSNYGRFFIDGTAYFPVFKKSVFIVTGGLAIAEKFSGDDIAIFDRFFAGGASTIRGFERREVGPVDVNEEPVGGRSRLLAGVELTRPLASWLDGRIFLDAGNVWKDVGDINPAEYNASIGVGVTLKLPIGPVRLDYGWPIVTDWDHLDGNGGELHFNLGYSF